VEVVAITTVSKIFRQVMVTVVTAFATHSNDIADSGFGILMPPRIGIDAAVLPSATKTSFTTFFFPFM
jgi:hypothetical protein